MAKKPCYFSYNKLPISYNFKPYCKNIFFHMENMSVRTVLVCLSV